MSISVLNNISSLIAENSLSSTQASLQSTLQQLSTGLKINSGSEDAAGLSIANGLGANIAALTQSSQNASNGIGLLQTADGALSQVTTLLNRAVTLATEGANGGLSTGSNSQSAALNNEYQSILAEINQIGSTTNFNGANVFTGNNTASYSSIQGSTSSALATTTALTSGDSVTIVDSATGGTFKFTASGSSTISSLETAITNAVSAGTLSAGTTATITGGKLVIATSTAGDNLKVTSSDPVLGGFNPTTTSGSATFFTSDGTTGGTATLTASISSLSATALSLASTDLNNSSDAATALTAIDNAVSLIAAQRGTIGATVNQLTADSNVETTEVQNLTSAQNNIQNADIGTTVASMTEYNVLEQTGFAALSQADQAQQNVLKLLQ